MTAILGAISVITAVESLTYLMLLVCYRHYINFCLNMLKKQPYNVYILKDLKSSIIMAICYGGHLGRHFENKSFPDVGFQGNLCMLLKISSTIQIRWKTVCIIIKWKIYNHLQAMAAILDSNLKIIAFPMWDFEGLLVCYWWYQILSKSVEKPLV